MDLVNLAMALFGALLYVFVLIPVSIAESLGSLWTTVLLAGIGGGTLLVVRLVRARRRRS